MPNYQKGKIYIINSPSRPEVIPYYGSTCCKLNTRFNRHRFDYKNDHSQCSSWRILMYSDAQITLVEDFPCNNIDELRERERFYIDNNKCVNVRKPGFFDREQWVSNHKEELKHYHKEYTQKNKLIRKENVNQSRVDCDCGGRYDKSHKARHLMTKRHLSHIEGDEYLVICRINRNY